MRSFPQSATIIKSSGVTHISRGYRNSSGRLPLLPILRMCAPWRTLYTWMRLEPPQQSATSSVKPSREIAMPPHGARRGIGSSRLATPRMPPRNRTTKLASTLPRDRGMSGRPPKTTRRPPRSPSTAATHTALAVLVPVTCAPRCTAFSARSSCSRAESSEARNKE
jgi:hypothetical protein